MSNPQTAISPGSKPPAFKGDIRKPAYPRDKSDLKGMQLPKQEKTKVVSAKWEKHKALVGEEVKLICELEGPIPRELKLAIFEHDQDGKHDHVRTFLTQPSGTQVEFPWTIENVGDTDDVDSEKEMEEKGYNLPEFHFFAMAGGSKADSGMEKGTLLEVKDVIDFICHDEILGDKPCAGLDYVITLADGRKEEGKVPEDGRIHVKDVPPGRFWFRLKGKLVDPFEAEAAEPGDCGKRRKELREHGSTEGAPSIEEGDPLTIIAATVEPSVAVEGDEVELKAVALGVPKGAVAIFRLCKLGDGGGVVAEVEAPCRGDGASARWTVEGASGTGTIEDCAYADFDLQVEIAGELFHSPGIPELRAFAERLEPPKPKGGGIG
jgi:hypothetical protein